MSSGYPHSVRAYSKANHTVSKTRQVVMLYDGVIRFMQQAKNAMETNDISERFEKLKRSGEIVVGLQTCLDFNSGGTTAQALFDFYRSLDTRIMALHRNNNVEQCDAIIADVKEMRDVWDRIDRGQMSASEFSAATSDVAQSSAIAAGALTVSA